MRKTGSTAVLAALGAAALYAVSIPLSPFLLRQVPPVMLAALLYLGAGLGMGLCGLIRPVPPQQRLTPPAATLHPWHGGAGYRRPHSADARACPDGTGNACRSARLKVKPLPVPPWDGFLHVFLHSLVIRFLWGGQKPAAGVILGAEPLKEGSYGPYAFWLFFGGAAP